MAPSIVSEESRRDARRFFSGILLLLGFVVAGFFLLLLLVEEGATSAPDVEVDEYPFEELVLLLAAFRLLAVFLFFRVLLGLGITLTLPLCPGTGPRRLAGE